MKNVIEMRGIQKSFGSKRAVKHLDLVVPQGSLHGFIGPNGAGKTTTIRMVMAILFPDAGELEVLGKPSAVESKDRIGYLPEERGIYRKMRVGAFLRYMAKLKGVDASPQLTRSVRNWLERIGLGDCEKKKCEELSKGMQQKVQFLATILHEPELLIFDEPFSGLDPVNMRLMRDLFLEQHKQGRTIIFSTHIMHQAEQLCEHIVMINQGEKVLDEPLEGVFARHTSKLVLFEPVDGADAVDEASILAIPGVREAKRADDGDDAWEVTPSDDPLVTIRQIVGTLGARRIEVKRPSLEDIFIEIVGDAELVSQSAQAEGVR